MDAEQISVRLARHVVNAWRIEDARLIHYVAGCHYAQRVHSTPLIKLSLYGADRARGDLAP